MRPLRLMKLLEKRRSPKDFAFSFSVGAIRTPTPRAFPFIESHRPQERNRSRSSSRRGSPSRLGRRVLEREFRTGVRQIMSHANTTGAPILFSSLFERERANREKGRGSPTKKSTALRKRPRFGSGRLPRTVDESGIRGVGRKRNSSLLPYSALFNHSTSLRLLIGVNVPSSFGRKT